jgi:hypothetical protein
MRSLNDDIAGLDELISKLNKEKKFFQVIKSFERLKIQKNPDTTTTLGTADLWPLLTGSRCSEVIVGSVLTFNESFLKVYDLAVFLSNAVL